MHSLQTPQSDWTPYCFIILLIFCVTFFTPLSHAQLTGDQAELMRLHDNAEEAMSMGDPQGAALNSGNAALMAGLMAKQELHPQPHGPLKGLEAFLRAQEQC